MVDIPKEVPVARWEIVRSRRGAHEWRTMALGVHVGSLIDVGRIPFIDSRIERPLKSGARGGMPTCCCVGAGSFDLRLRRFVYFLLLSLSLLKFKNLLSDRIHRILLCELMLFYALQGGLKSSKFSLVELNLSKKHVRHGKATPKIPNARYLIFKAKHNIYTIKHWTDTNRSSGRRVSGFDG